MTAIEYTIYEQLSNSPKSDQPKLENPISAKPTAAKPMQISTEKQTKHSLNTEARINDPSIDLDRMDEIDARAAYEKMIQDKIGYPALCDQYGQERTDEILLLLLDTICSKQKTMRIGGMTYNIEIVKSRFMQLDQMHIQYVFDSVDQNTTKIKNIKGYLLTALYSTPTTITHYYTAAVNHDLNAD